MNESIEKFDTWGVLEVMGHKRFAGRITEQTIAGAALVRVDVPAAVDSHGQVVAEYSKMFGVASVYCLTPTTEAVARRVAERLARWENANPLPVALPVERQLPAAAADSEHMEEDEVDDDLDDDDEVDDDWDGNAEDLDRDAASTPDSGDVG